MKQEIIVRLNKDFEGSARFENGVEFWMARDIQRLLDYTEWRNFLLVVDKAKTACLKSGLNSDDHFVDANKTIAMPKGAAKDVPDIKLTRYACYLIAQNGDPRKEQIAFAQSYFAVQTRKQELLEERIALVERLQARQKLADTESKLSGIVYERGVDGDGFARLRSKGDEALFGGNSTRRRLTCAVNLLLRESMLKITRKSGNCLERAGSSRNYCRRRKMSGSSRAGYIRMEK